MPTEHARGPWDPRALHGGAPAALIARAFERMEPGAELPIARLGFEFLKPIPLAPLTLTTRIVRKGRRVQELAAELTADLGTGGEELVCRASALRLQPVPGGLPSSGQAPPAAMPSREHGEATRVRPEQGRGDEPRDERHGDALAQRPLGPGSGQGLDAPAPSTAAGRADDAIGAGWSRPRTSATASARSCRSRTTCSSTPT